ncbi:MAG: hypothetical protein LBD65_01510, partial [Spirochaetaceae bacterium]|nr:hypothetical protein [Spirochaetaceae bacterium]
MAKKNAIYAPGELDRLRKKLGNIDAEEAKRVAQILGGEVGIERSEDPKPIPKRKSSSARREVVEPGHRDTIPRPQP